MDFSGSLHWQLTKPEVSMPTFARPEIQDGGDMQLAHCLCI